MIKVIIGGVGSGKSVSVIKEILKRQKKAYVNFSTVIKNTERLKVDMIITEEVTGYKKNGEPILKKVVNWDFWSKLIDNGEEFDIYIDEAHNIMHSRRSSSTWNVLFTIWLSQIRKILGSSEKANLYIISQRITGIDKSVRDLMHHVTYMHKYETKLKVNTKIRTHGNKLIKKMLPLTYIMKYEFIGDFCLENFICFLTSGQKTYNYRTKFIANFYYQYYNSYELLSFGNGVYV